MKKIFLLLASLTLLLGQDTLTLNAPVSPGVSDAGASIPSSTGSGKYYWTVTGI